MLIKSILQGLEATNLFVIIAQIELYQGVLLAYDPDLDECLKELVDRVDICFRGDLLVAHECDGALTLIWRNAVPEPFLPGNSIATTYPDGSLDQWQIVHSVTSQSIEQKQFGKYFPVYLFSEN